MAEMGGDWLLTGATGFVGRAALAELVAQGARVAAVYARVPGPALPGVSWHQADLLQPAARCGLIAALRPVRMIHTAWDVTHGAFWQSPANLAWRLASEDLARRFLDAGGQRLVVPGSCAEYDAAPQAGPAPWPESRACRPATLYGQQKHALCQALMHEAGPALLWPRLFHLFGPGEAAGRFVPGIVAALRAGEVAEVRAPGLIRDFASSARVARMMVALCESPLSGPVNLGSGTAQSLGALAGRIAAILGRDELLRLWPSGGADGGAGDAAGQVPVMLPDLRLATSICPGPPEDTDAVLRHMLLG